MMMKYALYCLVLLLCGRLACALPALLPVTNRELPPGHIFVFSAGGNGYPAIQSNVPLLHGLIFGTRLDARCRLSSIRAIPMGMPLVSFTRQFIGWSGMPMGNELVRYDAANHRSVVSPSPVGMRWLSSMADDGSFIDDNDVAYDAHAHPITLPKASDGQPMQLVKRLFSNDTRYLLLRVDASTPSNKGLYLYDAKMPWLYPTRVDVALGTEGSCVIYHDRSRVAIVPEYGKPVTLTLQDRAFKIFAAASTGWRCGEDGSQWRMANGKVTMLRWRGEQPHEEKFPVRTAPNHYFRDAASDSYRPGWAAVWHDGELVALTEMAAPRTRRLTLYRQGQAIGQFEVAITRLTQNGGQPNREHLAFTGDGRYLSWIVDTGKRTRVLVFRVW